MLKSRLDAVTQTADRSEAGQRAVAALKAQLDQSAAALSETRSEVAAQKEHVGELRDVRPIAVGAGALALIAVVLGGMALRGQRRQG